MKELKCIVFSMLTLLGTINVSGVTFDYDFMYGPLTYKIVSVKDRIAIPYEIAEEVEYLEIPYSVEYEGVVFNVPEVGYLYGDRKRIKDVKVCEGITKLDDTFKLFSSLETVSLPSTLTELGGTFEECTSLQSFVIPKSVEYITGALFSGCTSLSEVVFEGNPQLNTGDYWGELYPRWKMILKRKLKKIHCFLM